MKETNCLISVRGLYGCSNSVKVYEEKGEFYKKVSVSSLYLGDLEYVSVESAIKTFEGFKQYLDKGHIGLRFEPSYEEDNSRSLNLVGFVKLDEKELKLFNIEKEKQEKQNKEYKERAFEQLKKELGK